jgi:hypothetical protein
MSLQAMPLIYEWEKAKALALGYYSMAPMGHTGVKKISFT